ncbi:hypothetical protein ACN6MT_11295 [Neobacillus niacini]|uniref:hypothetical protein n=1 Tax=Neobacillus niacini TaxID=86668 RepID=UPI003B012E27
MLITFQILLFVVLFFSGVMTVANKESEEFRLKSVSLAIASMVSLLVTFWIG